MTDSIMEGILSLKSETTLYTNAVGYINDYNNKYMKKGSKVSPSDLGKETFENILKECVIWI